VAGLVLGVVAREVADGEGERLVRLRLDVPEQPGEMGEVLPRERRLWHLGSVDEVDLVPRDVAV
jgi:hypothetical protein